VIEPDTRVVRGNRGAGLKRVIRKSIDPTGVQRFSEKIMRK
jgi:hypothetical protein